MTIETRLPLTIRGIVPLNIVDRTKFSTFDHSVGDTDADPSNKNTTSRTQSHSGQTAVVVVNVETVELVVDVVLVEEDVSETVEVVVDVLVAVVWVCVVVGVEVADDVTDVVGVVVQPVRQG